MPTTTTSTATIESAHVGPMDNVAYVVRCRTTGRRLLIDAAAEPDTLLALTGSAIDLVVTTHRHHDHVGALAAVVEATGARTAAGTADADDLPLPVQHRLDHGDVVRVGDVVLEVIHLRGHTPGSVALLLRNADGPDHLFTGDSLFPGGVGNTQQDPERFTSLITDVSERLFDVLADDTVVHPGHGAPTTVGTERPQLPEWRRRGW